MYAIPFGFFAYAGLRPRADETEPTPRGASPSRPGAEDISPGIWGEK